MLLKTLALVLMAAETVPTPSGVVAHEWGTFTSVAGPDGSPMRWYALGGPTKLPCFVYQSQMLTKSSVFTTVRMETPVIYFYAAHPVTLSVDVAFPAGTLTEWYPQARNESPARLTWKSVQVVPGEDLTLPTGGEGNHYYTARATDAAPLRVGKEQEKLLFYRGAGDLAVPIRARFREDGKVELLNVTAQTVASAFVFENREGRVGYRVVRDLSGTAAVDRPQLGADSAALRERLAEELTRAGLYPKEALAMVETWRDSWFEEGTRVIYLVPRPVVEAALPLTISPAAAQTERVFVGRVEMLSPEMAGEIDSAVQKGDRSVVGKYGRFLQAFWTSLHGENAYLPPGMAVNGQGGCAK
jgi:hypothetical protein